MRRDGKPGGGIWKEMHVRMLLPLLVLAACGPPARAADAAATERPPKLLQWKVEATPALPAGSVQLPTVEVTGHRDAFRDADQRLRKTQAALPCSGCGGATAKETVGVVEKVLTGATELLKAQFVAAENAGAQEEIKDRSEAEAAERPMFRPGQLP